jgi:hypothetical protein
MTESTTPPPARCSRCRQRPVRAPAQRRCAVCHNVAEKARQARLRAAMAICKRAGLTVAASDSGFAVAPVVKQPVPMERRDRRDDDR